MSENTNLIKYQPLTQEDADAVTELLGGGAFFKFQDGRNIIRFLPARVGERAILPIAEHYIKLPTGTVRFVCPRLMAKGACIACARASELSASGSFADRDRAKEMWPGKRVYANLIDRRATHKGPQVVAYPKTIANRLKEIQERVVAGFIGGDYTHPTTGFDLMVTKTPPTSKDGFVEYKVDVPQRTSPLHPDVAQMQAWIDQQADLRQYARVPSADEILRMLGVEPAAAGGRQDPGPAPGTGSRGSEHRGGHVGDAIDADFSTEDLPF